MRPPKNDFDKYTLRFRQSKKWKDFNEYMRKLYHNKDAITGEKLEKNFHCHHLDMNPEHYEILEPDRFIPVNVKTHQIIHMCFDSNLIDEEYTGNANLSKYLRKMKEFYPFPRICNSFHYIPVYLHLYDYNYNYKGTVRFPCIKNCIESIQEVYETKQNIKMNRLYKFSKHFTRLYMSTEENHKLLERTGFMDIFRQDINLKSDELSLKENSFLLR